MDVGGRVYWKSYNESLAKKMECFSEWLFEKKRLGRRRKKKKIGS